MDISESLNRILESNDIFGESFYEIFFNSYPDVQAYFDGVDMKRQAVLLTMALTVVEQFYSQQHLATKKYLMYLGMQHHAREIPEGLYTQWRDAMLETLFQFHGDDWTPQLASQWREAIEQTTHVMLQGYQHHFTV